MHSPFNFSAWIDNNRDLLKPPVANRHVFDADTDMVIMVVGGPNARTDYHDDPVGEFFYQIEGDITVRLMEEGGPVDVPIKEGEIFLLPPRIPHSPQRPADTVGLVIERLRKPGELDHLRWYCEGCGDVLHDASFQLTDLGQQLKPMIEEFYGSETLRTCKGCGAVMEVPKSNA